jgi:hypothetical protein
MIDSPAEKMLIKLLLHNKLITESQLERVLEKSVGKVARTLHEELAVRHFVERKVMEKVVMAVEKKNLSFPLLSEHTES